MRLIPCAQDYQHVINLSSPCVDWNVAYLLERLSKALTTQKTDDLDYEHRHLLLKSFVCKRFLSLGVQGVE